MKYHKLSIPAVLLTLLMVLLVIPAAGCATGETAAPTKVVVAVTLLPQAGFVEAVGGERVETLVMVPPGAEPHNYAVTPDQMVKLSKARMYAKVGSPVEFELAWLDKLRAANSGMLMVDCARGIELIKMADEDAEHADGKTAQDGQKGLDPHIWLSARNAKVMTRNIYEGLRQIDPSGAAYYEKNYNDYISQLSLLDEGLTKGLAGLRTRSFIVFHPAFGYFARDYGLKQIAIEQEGKEPEADYLVRLIKEAKAKGIQVIFVAPQFSSKSAEVIASEIGGRVVAINPLAKDFVGNMRAIESAMRQALK
jgi:zinc transport system substrate-binding protein